MFWIGKEPETGREAVVRFAIANKLEKQLPMLPTGISSRLITLIIPIWKTRCGTGISAYATPMTNSDGSKEECYGLLVQTLQTILPADKLITHGYFNASVGDNFASWRNVQGTFDRDNSNLNGEQSLVICTQFKLASRNILNKCLINGTTLGTLQFKTLSLISLTPRVDLGDVQSTRAMRGADCSTDHYLIRSLCNLHFKPPGRKIGPTTLKKLNVSKPADSGVHTELMEHMKTNMMNLSYNGTINNQWETLCEKVYETYVDTLGHTTRKHQD